MKIRPRRFSTQRSLLLFALCISLYLSLLFNEHVLFAVRRDPPTSAGRTAPQSNASPPTIHNAAPHAVNDGCLPVSSSPTPRIYLHIGPHKTGTTSLQDYLACNTEFLAQHRTHYLGKINPNDVKACPSVPPDLLRPLLQNPSARAAKQLQTAVAFHLSQNHSVILSSEDMLDISPALLAEALSLSTTPAVPIVPVVGYRRYHEWLTSLYRFRYEPHWYDLDRWREWNDDDDDDGSIPTLRSFVTPWIAERRAHPTLERLQNFSSFVVAWTTCPLVLNLHADRDVATSFLEQITDAPPSSMPPPWRANVRIREEYAVDAEILALRLRREGKLAAVLPRRVVVDVLRNKMRSLYWKADVEVVPPLDCLGEEEEEALLRATREAEREVVSEFYRRGGKDELEKEFREMAGERHEFCNVNLEEMLQEPGWETILWKLKMGRLREEDFAVRNVVHVGERTV
ncbi:hypothetical protein ACHAWX_001189 [Stephanocyclus meneghinianus]